MTASAKTLSAIRALIAADVPAFIWGPPGTGKTAAITAMAAEQNAHMETLISSTLDPCEVWGYLRPTQNGVIYDPPPWARRLRQALDRGQRAWLFLDELNCGPPSIQAALLRVIQERQVGELSIEGCYVIAAANPVEDAADGGILSSSTGNRFGHVDWEIDPMAWVAGELSGWGRTRLPPEAAASAKIASFIRRHPDSLLACAKTREEARGRAWPSPRAWSNAAKALAYSRADDAQSVVAACVGDAAARSWAEYQAAHDLPDPEDVLAGKAAIPSRGDQAHAALAAVIAAALAEHEQRRSRIDRAWAILANVRPDLAIVPARALLDATGEVPDVARDLGRRILRVSTTAN